MTRLGSFGRKNERSVRRAVQTAVDAAPVPAPILDVVLSGLENRARSAGASDELLALATSASSTDGVRVRIATLRLLIRVGSGDTSAISPLLNKLPRKPSPALLWDVMSLAGFDTESVRHNNDADLLAFFEPEIGRAFESDGYSQVFEWLLDNRKVSQNSALLRPLLERLVASAIEDRDLAEDADPAFVRSELVSVIHSVASWPHQIALWGPSLLAALEPNSAFSRFGSMELATFDPIDDVLLNRPSAFDLVDRRHGHVTLCHRPTRRPVTLVELIASDEYVVHGNGHFTRWHSPLEITQYQIGELCFAGPSDHGRYLAERFGEWHRRPFFYDPLLDAPNTTVDRSLDGLLFTYFHLSSAFESGHRHYADEWAAIMRDRFGIDYSSFVPRGVARKVLATPATTNEVGGRTVRLAISSFGNIEAHFISWLDTQKDDNVFLVAAVTGQRFDPDAVERLALANSLRSIDHAILIESEDDLRAPIAGVEPDEWVMHPNEKAGILP